MRIAPLAALAAALLLAPRPAARAGTWSDDSIGVSVDAGADWDVTTSTKDVPGEKLGRAAVRFSRGEAVGWLLVYGNAPWDPAKDAKEAARNAAFLLRSRYEPQGEKLLPGFHHVADLGAATGMMLEFEVAPASGEGRTRAGRAVAAVLGGRLHILLVERPAAGATAAEMNEMERLALSLRPAAKAGGTKTDLKVVDSVPDTVKGDALPGSEFRSSVEMRRVATLPSGLQVFRQYYLFEGERMPSYLMHLLGKDYEKDGKKGKTPDLMLMLLNNKAGKEPATVRVELTLLEFSEPSARTVTIQAGETEAVSLSPVFAKSLYDLTEQKPGAVRLRVTDPSGRLLHEETEKVVLLGRNDFFWKDGTGRSWAPALSAFVTPHDMARKVDGLLRQSKDHCPLDAMLGYQDVKGKERSAVVLLQMKAVYEALAATGWSYVNAPMSADARAQRIKFPTETLEDRSGNCIEAVLVFASAFESMGMRPVILVYEDHAQVAVRSWTDDPALIVLETTLCGRAPFEEACKKGFERFKKAQDGTLPPEAVDVRQWRLTGFTPVPR